MEKFVWRISAAATLAWGLSLNFLNLDSIIKIAVLAALLIPAAISLYFIYRKNPGALDNLPTNIADKNHISNLLLKETFIICVVALPLALLAARFLP